MRTRLTMQTDQQEDWVERHRTNRTYCRASSLVPCGARDNRNARGKARRSVSIFVDRSHFFRPKCHDLGGRDVLSFGIIRDLLLNRGLAFN
jgi:hypothetical protein